MGSEASRLVGTMLDGRYRIDAPIARGGMSTVYQGVDLRLDRPVAIKLMDPQFSGDPQFLSRFEMEARSVAKLSHPALVAVFDQGVDGDHVFIVMELVPGGTLRELLRERGPMPPHAATAVALPVLEALGVAHQGGLVHRDVKPENVLISDGGVVKIADFGLVRAVAQAGTTSSSVILGTAAYLSPEQVESGNSDARSDVYAMGILLFEMLTGKVPFTGDTSISIAYQRINNDVPPPSSAIAGVPPEFDHLVLRATSRDPKRRYKDATEMAAALESVAKQLALPAFTVPAPQGSAQHRTASAILTGQFAPAKGFFRRGQDKPDEPAAPAAAPASPHPTSLHPAPPQAPAPPQGTQHTRALTQVFAAPPEATPGPPPAPVPARQRRGPGRALATKGRVALLVVLLLAVLLGLAGWWIGFGSKTTVPQLMGLDRPAVLAAVEAAGLNPVPKPVYHNTEPIDKLLEVDPAEGSRVREGSDVVLGFAAGRPAVPQLDRELDIDEVRDVLRELTFVPVVGEGVFSRQFKEGAAGGLSPAPGTVLDTGSEVTIHPSLGEPAVVPDVRAMTEEQARAALGNAGLEFAGTTETFDETVAEGRVANTDPPAGTEVAPGSAVTLAVSTAMEVPSVVGRTVNEARRTLEEAGFTVRVQQLIGGGGSRVLGQSPSGGSRLERGGTVTITAFP